DDDSSGDDTSDDKAADHHGDSSGNGQHGCNQAADHDDHSSGNGQHGRNQAADHHGDSSGNQQYERNQTANHHGDSSDNERNRGFLRRQNSCHERNCNHSCHHDDPSCCHYRSRHSDQRRYHGKTRIHGSGNALPAARHRPPHGRPRYR
ncbi:MAG: hypothetical protein II120_03045, partial [Bacteroidales bacterium]|nr:hypothetical protein [Bacteroidales bacterium]